MGRPWRSLLCFLAILSLSATAGYAAAPPKQERASQRLAFKLFFQADRQVQRDRACRTFRRLRRPRFSDRAPSEELLSTLGVLRRPQSEEEERLASGRASFPFAIGQGVYRRFIRVATSASGKRFVVFAARDVDLTRARPERCRAELRRRFERLLRGRPPEVRRFALRIGKLLLRSERRRQSRGPQEGVFLFDFSVVEGRVGGGGGGSGAREIRRNGLFSVSSIRGAPRRARVNGLVPDGVAMVTSTFGRAAAKPFGPGRRRKPKPYPRSVKVTVPVQDNVVSFTVPRAVQDAFAGRMVWRSADGRVVRVVRGPR